MEELRCMRILYDHGRWLLMLASSCSSTPFPDLDLERAAEAFTGDQMQVPPMYSAVHVDGQRLYKAARLGLELKREARPITGEAAWNFKAGLSSQTSPKDNNILSPNLQCIVCS